jgi:LDH2 family malate/lactate/ureidoglycolate dehydrogenase
MKMRTEDSDFLELCYKSVWMAAGACEEHADTVARSISLGDQMGKLTQGIGVFEAILITLESGNLDIKATPTLASEGPT